MVRSNRLGTCTHAHLRSPKTPTKQSDAYDYGRTAANIVIRARAIFFRWSKGGNFFPEVQGREQFFERSKGASNILSGPRVLSSRQSSVISLQLSVASRQLSVISHPSSGGGWTARRKLWCTLRPPGKNCSHPWAAPEKSLALFDRLAKIALALVDRRKKSHAPLDRSPQKITRTFGPA